MKRLCLITDHYPFTRGELPFVLPELAVTHQYFDIQIFSKETQGRQEYIPPYGIPAKHFDLIPSKALKAARYLLYKAKPMYQQEVKEKHPNFPRDTVESEVRNFLFQAETLRKWLKKEGCFADLENTVYYTFWYSTGTMALVLEKLRHPQMKIATRAHGYDLYDERQPCGQLFKSYMDPYVNLIAFISRTGRDYYLSHFAEKKNQDAYRVFYLGVPDNGLNPPAEAAGNAPMELFSCSNVIPLKRISLLVQAIQLLKFPVHWYHAGGGESYDEITALCHRLLDPMGNITWEMPGAIPNTEVMQYYQRHHVDLFLTSSQTEGLPVSIMEAYSYGVPVAATAVGGIPEMVNSGTGYLLSKNPEPQEIAEVIRAHRDASHTMRASLRLNARQLWFNSFHDKKNHEKFAKALLSL
ncbi:MULTISPECIES: glycosyltransferase [Caproicibacterium]|uniref:Glycosyltransferase n=1 Tax=Caproicibacterium argilliputei TaxID=3030016 RepID=A0AA97H2G4_9FIRM|nr:glycosyltransferase [Caproicibacterium argilliputei]WOC33613.1 glycosyltransferase [Caproicibacterium argilliputei]